MKMQIPTGLQIDADIHMLQVVLRNLLTNAIKFTPKNGKVMFSAIPDKDGYVKISVNDSGIGMDADLMDRLFKINGNTGRKGTDGEASTGLGLILCKEFVERQHGSIWAESPEGKGSTFCFTIPLHDSKLQGSSL